MIGTELYLYELGKQKMQELIENSERKRMLNPQESHSFRFPLRKMWNLSSRPEYT
ncbi:MAG: hypothetical protein HXS41_02800 [Theionarchaea archaeon]|nr:hypothetical protein [Theionarchaea archaeon]